MLISLNVSPLNLEVYEKRKQLFAADFWLSCVSLNLFRPTSLRETINSSLAQFGPIGRESQTHVHSEGLLNFPIGREGKRIISFLSHRKIFDTPKVIKI